MQSLKRYLWNILLAVDHFINAVFGGDPHETISSRCQRNRHIFICDWVLRLIEMFDPNHGPDSLEPADHHKDEVL